MELPWSYAPSTYVIQGLHFACQVGCGPSARPTPPPGSLVHVSCPGPTPLTPGAGGTLYPHIVPRDTECDCDNQVGTVAEGEVVSNGTGGKRRQFDEDIWSVSVPSVLRSTSVPGQQPEGHCAHRDEGGDHKGGKIVVCSLFVRFVVVPCLFSGP